MFGGRRGNKQKDKIIKIFREIQFVIIRNYYLFNWKIYPSTIVQSRVYVFIYVDKLSARSEYKKNRKMIFSKITKIHFSPIPSKAEIIIDI